MKCAPICKDQTCRYWQKMPPEFEARYGNCVLRVANEGPKTLEFVAQIFGITRERVRQIEAIALRKMARRIREMGLAEIDEKPIESERATLQEKPIRDKRATPEENPIPRERARAKEKPTGGKRAKNVEKPVGVERAPNKEKPFREKRYMRPMPHEFLLVTEEEILLARE